AQTAYKYQQYTKNAGDYFSSGFHMDPPCQTVCYHAATFIISQIPYAFNAPIRTRWNVKKRLPLCPKRKNCDIMTAYEFFPGKENDA
ncbi:MAG: hypothetical protein IJN83_03340, partial [Clostridia bacterium]|nr:hypothetical protein [Clostridia bacterium]